MYWISLDYITRSVLNQKQLLTQWYPQYLKLAADCYRELTYDALRCIRSKKIALTAWKSIYIPCDYVNWVRVGVVNGQRVLPLVQDSDINRLNNTDSNGNNTVFGNGNDIGFSTLAWYNGLFTNNKGELLGGEYGYRQGTYGDGFIELRERNEIQITEMLDAGVTHIILDYISNGTDGADAATRVDPLAQNAIEKYVFWKSGKDRDNLFSAPAEEYKAAVRVLVARKNPMSKADVIRAISSGRFSAPH